MSRNILTTFLSSYRIPQVHHYNSTVKILCQHFFYENKNFFIYIKLKHFTLYYETFSRSSWNFFYFLWNNFHKLWNNFQNYGKIYIVNFFTNLREIFHKLKERATRVAGPRSDPQHKKGLLPLSIANCILLTVARNLDTLF